MLQWLLVSNFKHSVFHKMKVFVEAPWLFCKWLMANISSNLMKINSITAEIFPNNL